LDLLADLLSGLTKEEAGFLDIIAEELSRPEAHDPKLGAVKYFLTEHRSEGRTWLEHGCIVFSQYYDTVRALALELSAALPSEPIAVYAGADKSSIVRDGEFAAVEREAIKAAVRRHEIRLLVATDAACEGLNLQMLGTLINVDLPWNPSRLEQRLGRIKRFGQRRLEVDMLNLVYHDTQDEKIYAALSRRMKDRFRQPARCDRGRVDRRSLSRCSISMCICGRRRAASSNCATNGLLIRISTAGSCVRGSYRGRTSCRS